MEWKGMKIEFRQNLLTRGRERLSLHPVLPRGLHAAGAGGGHRGGAQDRRVQEGQMSGEIEVWGEYSKNRFIIHRHSEYEVSSSCAGYSDTVGSLQFKHTATLYFPMSKSTHCTMYTDEGLHVHSR